MKPFYTSLITALCIVWLFSSCATIVNSSVQKLSVSSANNVKVLSVGREHAKDSSLPDSEIPQSYYPVRDKRPITIEVLVDSTVTDITLQPRNSFAFWANLYADWFGIVGMLIDWHNPKRWGYRPYTHISIKDSVIYISRFAPMRKGSVNLFVSAPFTTIFNMQEPNRRQYKSAGLFGLETGIDYAYATNRYLSLHIGAANDLIPVEYFGAAYKSEGNTFFTSIRNNHVVGSFDFGYGISISKFNWSRTPIHDSTHTYQSLSNISAGLSLSAQYRVGKVFHLGILYQPGLLNTSFKPAFNYEHYISLNLIWAIPLNIGKP